MPPSLEDLQAIAEAILDELPDTLRKRIQRLKVQVEDYPDAFIEQEMELETPFDLLGCYQSSLPSSHLGTGVQRQDILFLYRRPILDVWAEELEDLTRLVNRVMLQEIGHHFGHTPEEIEMFEEDVFGTTVSNISAG